MSSVGQAPAVQSACGCVGFGCAPRWGGKEKSVTPAAIRSPSSGNASTTPAPACPTCCAPGARTAGTAAPRT
ncbi:unnamed protein product [Gulo gulo]|uniref:Uncharacterized protein n=1 Tax=Gulo gulo TaxID=48420 RepID=A0A9X9M1I8_GULGU|nr:unnamed protein product [Gulo gulo]